MNRFLHFIEHTGNKIPHPSLLFAGLCAVVWMLSLLLSLIGLSATLPGNEQAIEVRSLVSGQGIEFMLTSMVQNFMTFAPVGTVIVAMLGIGIAERSGLLGFFLTKLVSKAKGKGLTFIIALAGILSSIASDSGYVILIPLSALLFITAGRPAIAGIATAFAGVSAGYGANLVLGPFDVLLAGISEASAQLIDPVRQVEISSNWLFCAVSTFFLAGLITLITENRQWHQDESQTPYETTATTLTTKGLLLFTLLFFMGVTALVLPENAPLRNAQTGSLSGSPFLSSIAILIALYFAGAGIVFGLNNKKFTSSSDVISAMESTMATMSGYLVLMFFAAQFIAYFNWSNLGLVLSIKGAEGLKALEASNYILLIVFILITCLVNLFIGSGSAKWTLLAPIFVPMLMMLGIQPETTQMAYRIGDSATNIITPMMPYFALVLSFLQKYQPKAGLGTLLSAMLPYSLFIGLSWTAFFMLWLVIGLPLGTA